VHAKASSGLPVTFVTEGVCTVHREVVHPTRVAGICRIMAWQGGNQDFNPARPVIQAVAITYPLIPTALHSSGRAGGLVSLRYRTSAWSISAASVVVRRNGKAVARLHDGEIGVRPGIVYSVPWHAPSSAAGGALRFCVTLHDRTPGAPAQSYTDCAPIRLHR
jgi:hypothetical protein